MLVHFYHSPHSINVVWPQQNYIFQGQLQIFTWSKAAHVVRFQNKYQAITVNTDNGQDKTKLVFSEIYTTTIRNAELKYVDGSNKRITVKEVQCFDLLMTRYFLYARIILFAGRILHPIHSPVVYDIHKSLHLPISVTPNDHRTRLRHESVM